MLRKEYSPVEQILREINSALDRSERIDCITFSGSGEPTLHSRIAYLIDETKSSTKIPVAVLTNASLLYRSDVRHDLASADIVLPTLCTTDQRMFNLIHRNHVDLDIKRIINGLIRFRKEFNGKIWLEIMLIKGINDKSSQINEMRSVIEKIRPDKIHLNTVVRPPTEEYAHPVTAHALRRIRKAIGQHCEIIVDFKPRAKQTYQSTQMNKIISMIDRRPMTMADLVNTTGISPAEISKSIGLLLKEGKIAMFKHGKLHYYRSLRGTNA